MLSQQGIQQHLGTLGRSSLISDDKGLKIKGAAATNTLDDERGYSKIVQSRASYIYGVPAKGSINAIIKDNPRERLYVRPLAWTRVHLELLNVAFVEINEPTGIKANRNEGRRLGSGGGTEEQSPNEKGHCILDTTTKTRVARMSEFGSISNLGQKKIIRVMLAAFGIVPAYQPQTKHTIQDADLKGEEQEIAAIKSDGFFSPDGSPIKRDSFVLPNGTFIANDFAEVEFRFGKDIVSNGSMHPDGIFEQKSTGTYVAYVNFITTYYQRERYVARRSITRKNNRGLRGGGPRQRSITPQVAWEDPYIAGILVALAQEQRRRRVPVVEDIEEGTGQRVHAICTKGSGGCRLFVYTALIPDRFLDKLERPSEVCGNTGVIIRYFSMNFAQPLEAVDRLWLYWRNLGLISQDS
ncbi:hypothetical protein E4U55_001757 [Claviceps digitariae]|nr:hypothetical protein E4U55_001757 [Claviceps digitariae]